MTNMKQNYFLLLILLTTFVGASAPKNDTIIQKNEDRKFWIKIMLKMADPVLHNLSKGELKKNIPKNILLDTAQSRYQIPHIESFSRTFCGLAPWLGLEADKTPEGLLREKYQNLVVKGLSNFVDPYNPDYCNFGFPNQTLLEAGYIALGFLSTSEQLWNKLDKITQERIIQELKKTRPITPHDNNFILFQSIIELFIYDKTGICDKSVLFYGIERFFNDFYVGDGYYKDGPLFTFDYYNSYIIHPMLTKMLAILSDKGLADKRDFQIQLKRHQRYSELLERFISPSGHYPLLGRTISCRVGAFHALSHAAYMKILPQSLKPNQVRSALTAVLKNHFSENQNFDNQNWLVLGFNGKQLNVNEKYITTGSLYHAVVFFTALGLPETDSFWKTPFSKWTSYNAFSGQTIAKDKAFIEYSNFSLLKKTKLKFGLRDNQLLVIGIIAISLISFVLGLYVSKFIFKRKE